MNPNAPAPGAGHGPALSRLLEHTALAVQAVRDGRSLTDALARCPAELRAGTQALSFHVLRHLGGAQAVRALMAPKSPPPKVDALLTCALALLWPVDEPPYADHTLVDQTVTAMRHRAPAAVAFTNGVLRRFVRERAALVAQARHQPVAAWNHPLWWIERLKHDWPAQWQALLQAANQHPPMVLRVNARRGSAAHYVQRLAEQGRAAHVVDDPLLTQAVVLQRPCPVTELPGFDEGEVSVQDLAAQRAVPLLLREAALPPGARVLDACAAPGGKTAQWLELADVQMLALDADRQRLERVQDTLHRLQLQGPQVKLAAQDARQVAAWWDGQPFDAILLDAPCSASGIVRRHPDVRWLRRPEDITALARVQAELLQALWPTLKPGGLLLYVTCSLFKAEGQQQIDAFLQRHAAEGVTLLPASPGHVLPLPDNPASALATPSVAGDGFYYALLRKP